MDISHQTIFLLDVDTLGHAACRSPLIKSPSKKKKIESAETEHSIWVS